MASICLGLNVLNDRWKYRQRDDLTVVTTNLASCIINYFLDDSPSGEIIAGYI